MSDLGVDVPQIADEDFENNTRFPARLDGTEGWVYATLAQFLAKIAEAGVGSPMVALTQAEYDALTPPDENTYYFIID